MSGLHIRALQDDLGFGARIDGITHAALQDEDVRRELRETFESKGFILFENVEPSSAMQVAISNVFGELKEHPSPLVRRVDDALPGVIEMRYELEKAYIIELAGKQLSAWLPWHYDHCYNNELNRAGVLRAIEIPPEGGLTSFADGIELYQSLSPDLRARIEDVNVIYTLDLRYETMRFGKPDSLREVRVSEGVIKTTEYAKTLPRALHPAVWTRASGEKVLHVSPWMAMGIEGAENADGDALLAEICTEIAANVRPYVHAWKHTDMIIWDNWRLLHAVSGHDPHLPRCMHRTTIKGDYGLGRFEHDGIGDKLLEMTV